MEIYSVAGEGNIGLHIVNVKYSVALMANAMKMRMCLMINVICGIWCRQMQQFADFAQIVKITIYGTFTDRWMLLMNVQINFFGGWMIGKISYGVQYQFALHCVSDVTHAYLLNRTCFYWDYILLRGDCQ